MRHARNITRQSIDLCDSLGLVKTQKDEFGISMMVNRCILNDEPLWRTKYCSDWVTNKEALNISPEGFGGLATKQMQAIAPLLGRIFVFDYISKRGYEGGRLCLPHDVPAEFDPAHGIRKAA
jgi:hypothetical protein